MSNEPVRHSPALESRVRELGQAILGAARGFEAGQSVGDRWVTSLLERSTADERFRVQALRFVDLMPVLTDDGDLIQHLQEYFAAEELPLPGIARWGLARAGKGPGASLLAGAVRKAMSTLAQRFLGGSDVGQVLATVSALEGRGLACSLDRLGEAVVSEVEAEAYLQAYLRLMDRLGRRPTGSGGPLAGTLNLSVKLSSLYSLATPRDPTGSVAGVLPRLRTLLRRAMDQGLSVCLDMEQYELKEVALQAFRTVLMEPEFRGWPQAGIALQAYLREGEQDLGRLIDWVKARGTPVAIRLVRGAYWDQETTLADRQGWPSPVWAQKWQSDASFERCLVRLFDAQPWVEPAVASHNLRSLALAMALAESHGIDTGGFEFQMLYGMGESLREAVAGMGYRMRVYVPFGELLPGMAYLVRRLLENSSSQSFLSMGRVPDTEPGVLLAAPAEPAHGAGGQIPRPPRDDFENEPVRRFTATAEREAFAAALERVKGQLGHDYAMRVGGEERYSSSWITSINPARPDEVIGRVASAGEADAETAIQAAAAALPDWRGGGTEYRARLLRRVAGLLRRHRDEFAAWEVYEAGKNWREADADVCEAVDFLNYYARQSLVMAPGHTMDTPGETNRYAYAPRGVGVIIPPWNFPLAILTGMLSAAIVTGNTAVLKPSSQTPVIAARFAALLREAGLPDGVVNFLPGEGRAVGEFLVRHPAVHFVAFTGSVAVGTRINRLAAEPVPGQHHVKRVIAEMGGKNAIIVDASADLDDAVLGTLVSAFGYQGQKCSACSRAIVVASAYEAFVPRLMAAAEDLPVGLPEAPGMVMGPVIELAARDRIRQAIDQGTQHARLAMMRDVSHLEPGFFLGPAVFTEVDPGSPLAQEEIFGPVLAVMRARDFDEALTLANGTRYALTGGVYSRTPSHLARARQGFEVGNLYINRQITAALVGRQPFGGFRLSGVGSKAGGPDYLLQFVEPRTITENTLRRGYAPGRELARGLADGR
jgi:RHH-type proline utilization regulon transcriptional repressor/proline dehydrogenase/delta 1-pyrroline-5-carboxylate dehydrogenase